MEFFNKNSDTEFPELNTHHMLMMFRCMGVCAACSKKCIEEGHKKTAALCGECADVCSLAIKAANGQFEFKKQIMELCEQVCKRCSEECKQMSAKHCQECAEVCKQCADACSKIH